uniref:Serine and arginine rich splicing factor 11 n=1 Tax=Chelonoidis abingdonii TaxID=106734 RepID=A0A8C0GWK0_CHEAB
MININRNQALYFSQHKYFQQTQVVYQGDIFWVYLCCFSAGIIPDETKALSLLAPANAVAGLLPGGGLLPTPNPLSQIGAVPLAALGAPALDPALAALGLPGANLNSQSLAADQLLKLMSTVDPKLNHVAAGLVSPSLKSDTSSKEIEEAMKRVREAQSLISAAIELSKVLHCHLRHKKEKKKDKDKERSRDERERSTSKKKKSKDKEKDRERKSESDKDVKQVTRDYDEEEQGYDSEKEKKEEKKVADSASPKIKESPVDKGSGDSARESKVNGDDHHEEDMDMSD